MEDDILAHANQYTANSMRSNESDPFVISGSFIRHNRAVRLHMGNFGELNPKIQQVFITDRINYPASICYHSERVIPGFSVVIDLTNLEAHTGRGNHCQGKNRKYRLEPWELIRTENGPEVIRV